MDIKYKNVFATESSIYRCCKRIFKDKKIELDVKASEILKVYKTYFYVGGFDRDVKLSTYESSYEHFMIDGYKHEVRYENDYKYEEGNRLFYQAHFLYKIMMELKNKGASFSNISNEDKKIVKVLVNFDEVFKKYDYDGRYFYFSGKMRDEIIETLKILKSTVIESAKIYFEHQDEK